MTPLGSTAPDSCSVFHFEFFYQLPKTKLFIIGVDCRRLLRSFMPGKSCSIGRWLRNMRISPITTTSLPI